VVLVLVLALVLVLVMAVVLVSAVVRCLEGHKRQEKYKIN